MKQKRGVEAVEKEFRQLSAEEREKFAIESLVNVDNIKVQRTLIPKDNKLRKDYIVVYHLLWILDIMHTYCATSYLIAIISYGTYCICFLLNTNVSV